MKLIAWNSQGAKWDDFWTNWLWPARADNVIGVLEEAGWAPWVPNQEVRINNVYWFDSTKVIRGNSTLCDGLYDARKPAFWIPWAKNLDGIKTNSRCSMGGVSLLMNYNVNEVCTLKDEAFELRPTVRVRIAKGDTPVFTILFVHLISGFPKGATIQLEPLIAHMSQMIPQGTPAIIVGDMNIDLLTQPIAPLPEKWRMRRTGVATQQSGGELDWGLLYDPNNQLGATTATVLTQFKTGPNGSDHSVIGYDIPI